MTDTELIEKVARFCELEYDIVEEEILIHTIWPSGQLVCEVFNPLTDDNDLWKIVVPRLPKGWTITFNAEFQNFYIYNLTTHEGKRCPLSDLNRAICELIAEMEERK